MTIPDSDFAVFDDEDASAQRAGVLALLPPGATVADLGAGHGRIAIPLARRGASVFAVDRSREALEFEEWTSRQPGITILHEDFLAAEPAWAGQGPLDLVCCLGNTLSLLLEEAQLNHLFALAFRALAPGGRLLFDDFPFWGEELLDPHEWPGGVSRDGSQQLAWMPDSSLFAFRTGARVDPAHSRPLPGERLLRLWSANELEALASASGWASPVHHESGLLMSFLKEI